MNKISNFNESLNEIVEALNKHEVKFLLVGGGAVNFHGYQRSSADVDFWVDNYKENADKLAASLVDIGFDKKTMEQGKKLFVDEGRKLSIKLSPEGLKLEILSSISLNRTFEEAYQASEKFLVDDKELRKINVLSFNDLIDNKVKSSRYKDLQDVKILQEIKYGQSEIKEEKSSSLLSKIKDVLNKLFNKPQKNNMEEPANTSLNSSHDSTKTNETQPISPKVSTSSKTQSKPKSMTKEELLSKAIFTNNQRDVNELLKGGVKPNKSHLQLMKEMEGKKMLVKPEIEQAIKAHFPSKGQRKGMGI